MKHITWNGSKGSVANRHGLYHVRDGYVAYESWRDSNGGAVAIVVTTVADSGDLEAAAEAHAAERANYPAPR